MSNTCSRADRRALERDETILAARLLRNLSHILTNALTARLVEPTRCVDLSDLHEQVAEALDSSMQRQSQLQDRWVRRRRTPRAASSIPSCARPYRHHGTYLGAFPSLRAVAARALQENIRQPSNPDQYDTAIDMHIHGLVWTIDVGGALHAFLVHPTTTAEDPETEE